MYKRAVITDEISQDIRVAAELASRYGLSGVELRSVGEKLPHELTETEIKQIIAVCADFGLTVCGLSSPCFKCELDDETEYAKHLEIFRRTVAAAHRFGVDKIRGFTFWARGDFEAALPRIADRYKKAVEIAQREQMTIVIEHDPSVYACNARKLARVIEAVGSASVKALWDPGNDIYDPDGEQPYPEGYELIKAYMAHFHLKDSAVVNGKATGAALGCGQVDIAGQLAALKNDGYDGWAVLETHWRPAGGIDDELLKRPGGSAFSADGYGATELCLQKWNEIEGVRPTK